MLMDEPRSLLPGTGLLILAVRVDAPVNAELAPDERFQLSVVEAHG